MVVPLNKRRKYGETRNKSPAELPRKAKKTQEDPNADLRPVLTHIISQLRPGADLSRVVLPTFILEPRSMLERITK